MSKKKDLRRPLAMAMAASMVLGSVPYHVMAAPSGLVEQIVNEKQNQKMATVMLGQNREATTDATSSATYYTKPNWEARIRDKSRWKVEDTQTLVRVTTSDPILMNDIDYDGMYINANGRYVIRLVYKERGKAASGVWQRVLVNFGDLDQYIDFGNSYVFGNDGKTKYTFDPVSGIKGRGFDVATAVGDRTNSRKNLPINLVLKDGVTLDNLPKKNYIIQMRLTDAKYQRVYSYAPGKSSMDYSSYTKTTSVSLEDNLNNLFIKGGLQNDGNNATNQEFFMSEFIANPDQYKDASNIGIIRTQYMGQRAGSVATPTVGNEPIAFTQVFDANLINYLKEDDKGYVAYINLLTIARTESPYAHKVGITKRDINTITVEGGKKLAYVVLAPSGFTTKNDVKVVGIPQHDQYTMLSGVYITAIDYLVDKSEFENTFSSEYTRKLDYSTMSGWTNPNEKGWLVYERLFDNDYVVQEGDSFMVDAGKNAKGKQIMIQVGGEQAILRRPQGYYNGYIFSKSALDNFTEIADGIFQFTIGEGTTVKKDKKLKIYMPYTDYFDGDGKINFLQIHNGTKLNEGAANLTLLKDRKINMHLYKQGKKGHFVLKYTLKDGNTGSLEFKPNLFWTYKDTDKVLTGASNTTTGVTGGNFYINTEALKEGEDIIVESYDANGKKIESETSWFKYLPLEKSKETVKLLTWTDHSDKRSVLSINKSLYTPYQALFTNDYVEGNAYQDPRKSPADNNKFNTPTTQIVGYTKYDSGKVRTLYEGDKKLFGKVEAAGNEYDKDGNLVKDVRKEVTIAKNDIFDAQFAEDSKKYKAYEYTFDLAKMLPYHSDDKTPKELKLLKDMKFVSTASDGSSLPSDLLETRVRARVLFDANTGQWDGGTKKEVKIVPDNINFYGEKDYKANGFEGANADTNTGDKFPQAPTLDGKTFLGWVTEAGKNSLGSNTTSVETFNNLPKEQVFNAETPVTKHLVVYAIYSEEKAVTFDANGGKFGDKEQIIVKTDSNTVTAPTNNPTKTGYTFIGWASSKNATEAEKNILENVDGSKTVYAVWEKDAGKELTLNNPENPVPVSDKTDLTAKEKDAVKDAVIAANPDAGLTKDNITVASDGKVTVTKGGKTGEIPADKTVTQKEVLNNINPPKKPVEVVNKESLTKEEQDKVRDAIITANPDLNLKPEEVTVDEKGNVTIEQGGKTGKVPSDKTITEESKIIKLAKPEKVEVKDVNNLTEPERDKVAEAVKKVNQDKLSDKAVVTVDANGNVTVTDEGKTGKLTGSDTVKPFDRTGKTLNKNIELTEVSNLNNLTEAEKNAVREAVKAANPDLAFTNDEIQVGNDGKVTVPMGKNETGEPIYETIAPEKTVKADNADTTISLKAPTKKTVVKDPSSLTKDEKDAVKQAVEDANSGLPKDAKITVADDGSVSVTAGGKHGSLDQDDTVVKKLDKPRMTAVDDGRVFARPIDDRTKELQLDYTDAEGHPAQIVAKKDTDGKWKLNSPVEGVTVDENTGLITIPPNKITNGTEVKAVAKDGDNTSDEIKATSKDNKAPDAPDIAKDKQDNVTVTLPKDKDAKSVTIKYTDPTGEPKEVVAERDGDGNWTVPAESGLEVVDGKVQISKDKIKPASTVSAWAKDASGNKSSERSVTTTTLADKTKPKVPDKTIVANPEKLTDDEKAAVKEAIENANKDGENSTLPPNTTITIADDGDATIKYSDGSQDKITGVLLVEKDKEAPGAPTVTANNDGSVTVTPPKDEDTKEVEVSYVPTGKTEPVKVTATKDPETGKWSVPAGSDVTVDENSGVITLPKDKVKPGTVVEAAAKDNAGNESQKGIDTTSPAAPTVTAKDDGSVEITPPETANSVEVSYTPTGKTDPVTVTATKGDNNKWTVPTGSDVTVDPNTGVITLPADKVKDDSEVSAKAKDSDGKESTTAGTATAKTPSTTPDTTPPGAPTVTANNDGSVTVTPPTDEDTKSVTVKYTDPDGNTKTVTATKGDDGTWTFDPTDSGLKFEDGKIVIPADKVKPETDVTAKAKDKTGNESTTEGKDKAKTPSTTPEATKPAAPTVKANDDGSVSITPATDGKTKFITVKYTDPQGNDKTVIATKGDDGSWTFAPADVGLKFENGQVVIPADQVKPGTEVSAKAKDNAGNESAESDKVKVPTLADRYTPSYTEADAQAGTQTTITRPGFTNKAGQVGNAPNGTTFKLGQGAPTGATIDANTGEVKYTPTDADAGKTITIPVVVKYSDGSSETVNATVQVAPKTGQETGINVPNSPITVDNAKALSPENKKAVEEAVKKANPTLPEGATIEVGDDGAVTVKDKGGKVLGTIPAERTVAQDANKLGVKAPTPVEVADPNHLTEAEKQAVEKAIRDANPNLPTDATIKVADDGTVTVTTKDGKTATLTPSQTVKGKTQGPERPEAGRGSWFFFGNGGFGGTSQGLVQKETKQVTERGRHQAYMYGYTDGTFRPDANITRSEAAAMIARLKGYDLSDKTAPKFSDTKVGWFKAAINAVFKNGLMKGYQDGSFRPNEKITRAEFAQMIKNIDQANGAVASFKDVKGHWAEAAINQAYGNGRIKGYPDGTFKPDAPISRAEAVTIANSLFERSVDNSGLKEKLENPTMISKFKDVNNTHWAFYEIMEATNSHEFERREKGRVVEDWLEIDKDKKH